MQLNPGQKYAAVWQADNQLDSATYYPQAVIRFSNTGKIWTTVNLVPDPSGVSQRYIGYYTTPVDGGMGVQIDMTISVYSDSAHTTLSQVYATVNRDYIISQLFSNSLGFSAGSDGLNADDVDKIVRAAIAGNPMPRGVQVGDIGEEFSGRLIPMLNKQNEKFDKMGERFNDIDKKFNKIEELSGSSSKNVDKLIKSLSEQVRDSLETHSFGIKEELKEYVTEFVSKKIEDRIEASSKELIKIVTSLENKYLSEILGKIGQAREDEIAKRNENIENVFSKLKDYLMDPDDRSARTKKEVDAFVKNLLG